MALKYVTNIASKVSPWQKAQAPILTDEDEAFLHRVVSNPSVSEPTPLPQEPLPGEKEAQIALMNGAQNIPLPLSPTDEVERELPAEATEQKIKDNEVARARSHEDTAGQEVPKSAGKKKSRPWSLRRWSTLATKKDQKAATAAGLTEIVTRPMSPEGEPISEQEQRREQEDMKALLEQLNLAAENNRVFSASGETQELLHKFKLIFKDLVTGVPTAYHDLESLLTNGDKQLRDAFGHLPGFLKKLIEQLPERFTEVLGPEVLAAASERASQSGIDVDNAGKVAAAAAAKKLGLKSLNLKDLVAKPSALVGVLRSIISFLRARFPAVMSMNVLWSVALFIVLLVLWYCHKRGREVRVENERLVTEAETAKMNAEYEEQIRATETLSTTAVRGASIEDVREGVQQVQKAREEAENDNEDNDKTDSDRIPAETTTLTTPPTTTTTTTTTNNRPNGRRFSLFKSSKKDNSGDIQPYPGT